MENPGMPPLRIAIVTDTFAPDINGVAMSLDRLCAGLRERGHQVQVIRSGRGGDVAVPWWPLPGYWEIRVGAPWPGQFRRLWQRDRPDIVYVAIETPLGFSAMRAAEKLGIPVVGGFHTNFREYLCNYGMPRFAGRVWRYQKWFHSRLACTLVPSPDARRKLLEAGFLNVEVLGRGVDTELFHPAKRSEALRREWGVADGVPVALVVGRVSPEKNIGLAIRAFERMRAACPELACVVVGDGPVRARLEREHPSVKFTGYRTGEELAACYASAVLLEGMASGLAVLAYDDAAAAWHGRHRENLLKVAKALESAFLDAAVELLDPALRATLGTAARQTSESLAWPAITAELERIFQRHIPAQP